ncbi:urease accessory protein UreD [Deinococcus aquiradiocola]|uniref:Urease accessory protein UreD n=1 Tax=Deinococcus aquiradiocola TaxID=393059 RepID=A0A917PLZ8_9DEIO|nr:urease accessory protein UreD [Deinococcus aquiradiocola]GGJ84598.1 urease accessory protein UreD [Deinococcus aquiradiocola]
MTLAPATVALSEAGRSTREGVLHLQFGVRGGRTVLTRDVQKAPLMVVRPFELPCGTLMAFVVNPTGGVLGGDHADIRVTVGEGARVLLLTQSATRVQPHPEGLEAVQDVQFSVAEGGRLEYHPERTIPFAGSAFRQSVQVDVAEGAQFGMTESLAVGRVAMGERLQFRQYRSRVEVRLAGRPVALERVDLRPQEEALDVPGLLGGRAFSASGVWVGGPDRVGRQDGTDGEDWPGVPGILACGRNHAGAVWLRAAAERGPDLDAALTTARDALRCSLFGAAPLRVRR